MNDNPSAKIQRKLTLIQERYEQGRTLVQQGLFERAIPVFESCFSLAAQQQLPLLIDQYIDITLSVAFCYADMHSWDEALEIYHALERIIKREGTWYKSLPEGLMVAFPESFEPSIPLAVLYDSIAVAYDNSNHPDRAVGYYQYSIETFEKAGLLERASQTWCFRGVGSQRRGDWRTLQIVGEGMLPIVKKLEDVDGQVTALRFLIQAHINQKELYKTAEYLEQLIEFERRLGHPDLAQDEAFYGELMTRLRRTQTAWQGVRPTKRPEASQTSARKWWQFWKD